MLNFSACGKDTNNPENTAVENFEGRVTYYDRVVIDESNYLLKIKTSNSEISFNVLPTTEIIGGMEHLIRFYQMKNSLHGLKQFVYYIPNNCGYYIK